MKDPKVANDSQKKLFFALCSDLGFDTETAKERAKKASNIEHFNDITSQQISSLINKLQSKLFSNEHPIESKEYVYKFDVLIKASEIEAIRGIFERINTSMREATGNDSMNVDAEITILTLSATSKTEIDSKTLNQMAKVLEDQYRKKVNLPSLKVKWGGESNEN